MAAGELVQKIVESVIDKIVEHVGGLLNKAGIKHSLTRDSFRSTREALDKDINAIKQGFSHADSEKLDKQLASKERSP